MSSFSDFALVSLYRTSLSRCGLLLQIPCSGWLKTTCEATYASHTSQWSIQSRRLRQYSPHNPELNISPEWLYLALASTRAKALYVILFTCSLSFGPTGLRAKSFYGPTGQKIPRAYGPKDLARRVGCAKFVCFFEYQHWHLTKCSDMWRDNVCEFSSQNINGKGRVNLFEVDIFLRFLKCL